MKSFQFLLIVSCNRTLNKAEAISCYYLSNEWFEAGFTIKSFLVV